MTRVAFALALPLGWIIDWYNRRTAAQMDQKACDDYNDTEGRPPEDTQ